MQISFKAFAHDIALKFEINKVLNRISRSFAIFSSNRKLGINLKIIPKSLNISILLNIILIKECLILLFTKSHNLQN